MLFLCLHSQCTWMFFIIRGNAFCNTKMWTIHGTYWTLHLHLLVMTLAHRPNSSLLDIFLLTLSLHIHSIRTHVPRVDTLYISSHVLEPLYGIRIPGTKLHQLLWLTAATQILLPESPLAAYLPEGSCPYMSLWTTASTKTMGSSWFVSMESQPSQEPSTVRTKCLGHGARGCLWWLLSLCLSLTRATQIKTD